MARCRGRSSRLCFLFRRVWHFSGDDGAVTNNLAIVPTTTGPISVFPSAATHLVLDIFGYFAP